MILYASISFLLFLCACTLHPRYERQSEVEVPTSWRISTEETSAYANLEWWTQFQDPVLDGLVEEALRNNQDLKVAIYNVEVFAAQLGIARSQLYPQASLDVNAGRQRVSQNEFPIPPPFAQVSNQFNMILNTSYELDVWGKIRSGVEAAQANLLAEIEARRTVVLTLIGSVATGYIQLRQFDEQLVIAEETLKSREEYLKLAAVRYDLGLTSLLEVEQAESEVEDAEVQVEQLKISIALQEDALSVLLGKPPETIPRGKILSDVLLPPSIPIALPSQVLNQRPDILQAEQNLISANAQIGVARALFFPDFSLTGAFGYGSSYLKSLFDRSSTIWEYGLSLVQQVFTGFKITNEVREAEAEKMALLHQYASTILNAFQEVNDALLSHKITLDLLKVQKEQVDTLKDYLRLSTLRYDNGQSDYLTVLDAERQLFTAQLDYVQTLGQSFTTFISIYTALGGGWVTEADSCVEAEEARVNNDL